MKEGGEKVARAGKSLGHNVTPGRIVRGSKHFGKQIGYRSAYKPWNKARC